MHANKLMHGVWWVVLAGATMFAAGVLPFATHGASGEVVNSGPLAVAAAPAVNLSDGQVVNVHAQAATGIVIYSITAHTCVPGKVTGEHSFSFAGQFCPNAPVGQGEVEKLTTFPGASSADFQYKIGVGTVSWTNSFGYPYALTCDATHPCDVVLKIEITNSTEYVRVPLCYGTQCPADAASAGAQGSSGGSSTTPAGAAGAAAGTNKSQGSGASSGASSGTAATAGSKPGTSSNQNGAGGTSRSSNGSDEVALTTARASDATVPPIDGSRGLRVYAAAIAGVIGGALIVSIVSRAKRRVELGAV